MSELSAAAAALGLPEALVERSAAARASETGASVDEILAQWAGRGGAPPPAPPPAPAEATDEEPATEETPAATAPATPEVVIEVPGEPTQPAAPASMPAGPYKPPVLVGARDNPMNVLAGVVGLFVIVLFVGLIGPSLPVEIPGARTSDLDYSEAALHGQEVFLVTGCAACHTQMVRPVVADVGLGPVSLNDTNQVLGSRRFGPDLSDVGSRVTASQIEAIIGGLGDHPAQVLDEADLDDLVAYLSESVTSSPGADVAPDEKPEEETP